MVKFAVGHTINCWMLELFICIFLNVVATYLDTCKGNTFSHKGFVYAQILKEI